MNKIVRAVLGMEAWIALALTGASLVWPKLLPAALIGMGVFWLLRILSGQKASLRTTADLAIGLVVLMSLVAVAVSSTLELTIIQVERLLTGILVFYAMVNWTADNPRRLKTMAFVVIAGGIGLAIAAPFITFWQDKLLFLPFRIYERFPLVVSDAANPNVIAGSLALLFPLVAGMLFRRNKETRWIERLFLVLALVSFSLVLVLTQSRGAWIAVILGCLFLFSLCWKRAAILTAILVLGTAVVMIVAGGQKYFGGIGLAGSLDGVGGREGLWLRAVYILRDFPLSGVGMGGFPRVVDALYPFEGLQPGMLDHAHSLLLQIGVDLGIPGLIGWLAAFFLILLAAWKTVTPGVKDQPGRTPGLAEGLFASQFVLILHGLVDAVSWGMVRPAPLVWILWGMVMAGYLHQKSED